MLEKIEASISTAELNNILERLESVRVSNKDDFAFGIAIGRVYNSFHYQTRRTLKRNATEAEFREFLEILSQNADAIKTRLQRQ